MAEFAPKMPERVRVPSYLEDPTVRSERERAVLEATIAQELNALNEGGELSTLEGDALVERLGEIGTRVALNLVERKYENPANEELMLAYHNRAHSEVVVARVKALCAAIRDVRPDLISATEQVEAELAAATHDIDHVFETSDKGSRKRRPGDGEAQSAERLTAIKEAMNTSLARYGKEPVFTVDAAADQAMIAVTIPGFDEKVGVIQKELSPATPLTARLLALADLGDFGMEGPEKLLASGKAIAIEDNADIVDAIRAGKVADPEEYRTRLIKGMLFQVPFARSRMNRFAEDLNGVEDPAVREAIVAEFPYFEKEEFEEAMRELEAEIARVKNFNYEQIVAYVGIPEFIERSA